VVLVLSVFTDYMNQNSSYRGKFLSRVTKLSSSKRGIRVIRVRVTGVLKSGQNNSDANNNERYVM